jgi:hypothetical protein
MGEQEDVAVAFVCSIAFPSMEPMLIKSNDVSFSRVINWVVRRSHPSPEESG